MFEGLVRQLLLGYLGRYVKDIQKEQLKITLWNEEVLLEHVELILEAFDYLQLPFALKQGQVGRLSIKIPWKKLGWDPIIIILEDVFISATQRGDQEWSAEAVEKREFAGKRAKLAAAELGKLSRRVCGSHAGQSFISYISAKILDSIQVAIRNLHVLYSDIQNDLEHIMIGLKFSSLTILKQHLVGLRVGQVNKTVEIRGLEFYSNMVRGTMDLMTLEDVGNSNLDSNPRFEGQSYKSILAPCEVSFVLSANRSEKVDDNAPQYSVTAELTGLVISIDEVQLQQIFLTWDYVCTCRLREKYGRYRPWHSPLSRKLEGWQILWWHYAQKSVLSDVRKRLRKTSWRYFWERLRYRRKYINLYKTKLNFLQHEQPVDDNVLQDLEQMEKESDLDDILNYRLAAENEMQECLSRCSSPETGTAGFNTQTEKSHNEEHSSGKSRGWLNWLSRGMLGAGGTDDCNQFSGVVSDDVIKDIYEATEFHPPVSTNGDVATNDKLFCAMKFKIHEISATLHSKRYDQGITEIIFEDGIFESKLYNGRTIVISKIKSGKMIDPVSKNVILHTCRPIIENEVLDIVDHSCSIQVDFSSSSDFELSIKGTVQQLDMIVDMHILSNLMVFTNVFTSFRFQNERVLASLNGIENVNTRLSSKTKCVFANHMKVMWDITIKNIFINVPWRNRASLYSNLVMMSKSISFVSTYNLDIFFSSVGEQPYSLKSLLNSISTSGLCLGIELHDLYNYFEVKLDKFEIALRNSDESQKVTVIKNFSASIYLASCVIPDESILKQLEVYVLAELLNAHFSPSIYGSFIELSNHLCALCSRDGSELLDNQYAPKMVSVPTSIFGHSISSKLGSLDLQVVLENNADNSSVLSLSLQEIDIWYASTVFEDILISTKSFTISSSKMKDKNESHVLIVSGNIGTDNESDQFFDVPLMADACFAIHYESSGADLVSHKCTVFLNNADIHCHPYLVGLFNGFFDRLSAYGTDVDKSTVGCDVDISEIIAALGLDKFGFSNYFESGSSECSSIPLDHFPFVTIYNSGSLCNLESTLLYTISDWRNYFTLRDRKIRNSKSSMQRWSKFYHLSPSTSKFDFGYLLDSGIGGTPNIISMEVNLCGMRLHFHDSSCIIGTIMLPASMSSLFFCEDGMDILCSTKGLVLSSSWWTQNFHDYLWGPSSDDFSPILNLRVRKGQFISSTMKLEVSISIQHVHCMLPPEYLSIIIGYLSLPDWGGNSSDQLINVENGESVTYKFEILDSHLVCPVENNECQFVRVEIQQLYGSFTHNACLDNVIKDITPECLVPVYKLCKKNDCLNLFGRDLFLSFLSIKKDMLGLSTVGQDTVCASTTLIAHLSADVCVIIPFGCESNCRNASPSTCVMTKISNCQIVAEDSHFFDGCLALCDVIEHFSLAGYESRCFKSDVLQFLHSKRSTDIRMVSPSASGSSTEIKFCVQSLLIDFYCSKEDSMKLIMKADLQFNCSASLVDDSVGWFDLGFSSLAFCSVHDSIVLAKCTSVFSSRHVLDMSFSRSMGGENELRFCLPSVEIWLHLSQWIEVVEFFNNICEHLAKGSLVDASSRSFPWDTNGSLKRKTVRDYPTGIWSESTSAHFALEEMENASFLMIRSDIIGITFHIPVWICEKPCVESHPADHLSAKLEGEPSNTVEGKDSKIITVYLNINSFELCARGKDIQLKSNMDKLNGMIIIVENKRHSSWPLFEIVQVAVGAKLSINDPDIKELDVDIICNCSDVWLSHPLFYLCRAVKIDAPDKRSSEFLLSGISIRFQLRKVSFLLTDGRWSCSGPQLEILMSNILLHANVTGEHEECSIISNFQINYNSIEKVSWEPFIEPWQFLLTWTRDQEMNVPLNSSVKTDINLKSTKQLNINITESLVECVSREIEMVMDALGTMGLKDHPEGNGTLYSSSAEYMFARQCAAPYVLQNLTSLPLLYRLYRGPVNLNEFNDLEGKEEEGKYVQPGSAIPIYTDESTADQLFHHRAAHSPDCLNDQRSIGFTHHYITIQLDGTSVPSAPISMDLVGVTCFEVNFSKTYNENAESRMDKASFVIPVVYEVSLQRFCKIIRIYSTVVLLNATSIPLELRFDIPLGVSPKILDPIHPGQQLPLPLHLAEAGSLRWRPLGHSYLWSEAHSLSKLLSMDNKTGNFKSLVCYPSHPSSDPFRCCLSVRNTSLTSSCGLRKNLFVDESKKQFVHHMILSSPLVVNNYLPMDICLTIESGGVNYSIRVVSEVETSVHYIDPSHDLGLEICLDGYKPSDFNFPRLETFCTMSKFSGTKFSLSETVTLEPVSSSGPLYITVEKVMDAYCGTREVIIFVPFLLYNCTGFSLAITEATSKIREKRCIFPSHYDLCENETSSKQKDGLSLLSSSHDSHAACNRSSMKNNIVSTRENASTSTEGFHSNSFFHSNYSNLAILGGQETKDGSNFQNSSGSSLKSILSSKFESTLKNSGSQNHDKGSVPCMYSPNPRSSLNDVLVKVSRYFSEYAVENLPHSLWSSPFFLLPPSGSSSILVPQLSSNAAFILAVTASSVAEPYSGRINAISFQPRYVISNACSKDISYKQKGTDVMFHLGIGEHAHLHWTDTTRELLVSICYSEPGWQWSGSFLPDHLGDTQVKMRNFVSGTTNMIRVEVQNADISMGDEKIVGSIKGNSGTNLILLSDDNTGYMPYRIDNFSKERLRIYQQKCEMFETIVHAYSSCLYAWDEPCFPHRVMVEVPGERVLGSYALDDVKDCMPIYLPSTLEKPSRTFFLSVHAEGPTKVLSVLDSNYHILNDGKKSRSTHHAERRLQDHKQDIPFEYKEKISIIIPYIGISLINSKPQELLFACMKDIKTDLLQSLDKQILSLRILFLQIDNQLRSTPYPVMLSFNSEYRSHYSEYLKHKNDVSSTRIEEINQMNQFNSCCDPVLCLSISKWKKTENSFISFEYIRLRMADFCLEIEQEVILSLFDFFTNISSRFHYEIIPSSDPLLHPCGYDGDSLNSSSYFQTSEHLISRGNKYPPLVDPPFNGKSKGNLSTPSIVPIGAPWQQIYLLARTQNKIYIEVLELAPINLTLSFSSAPWMLRNQTLSSKDSLVHRGLMALADVEGARIHLKELTIAHHMASLESFQDILVRHYVWQLLHEIYKLFGSAGVIGNPMGFARSMGLGIKDFLQVPAKSIMQSPTGLITGMAQGTTSLLSNTVYAISDAASQFSKAARKGIVAFTYDDQAVSRMEKKQTNLASDGKGVINEVLEGLTGLLQSPIRGAERHGLLGVLSGIALGVTGLVAKPAASILEVTGKTALSIRNRSKPNQIRSQCFRVRLPRPLSSELPLRPYSWEEAVGTSVLMEADDGVKFKDEKLVVCKELREAGKFVILTHRFVLIVFCPTLVKLGKPEFCGILPDFECIIELEIGLESVIHADTSHGVIHIVGSRPDTLLKQNQHSPKRGSGGRGRAVRWSSFPTHLPLSQTNLELASEEDAENFLHNLNSAIETGKVQGWGCGHFLHRANIKLDTD